MSLSPTDGTAPRRGARRLADVPVDVLRDLEAGQPSVNHVEQMAMDASALLTTLLPDAAHRANELRVPRFIDRLRAGAQVAWDLYGERVFKIAEGWESDTARGWAAFAVPLAGGSADAQLRRALAFADDRHFAVREWAWLGVRPTVVSEPERAVAFLAGHVHDPSPRVRRFCSEVTRPRGVWSAHVGLFKIRPAAGLAVTEPLAADRERYVRDSVGNWLNDAARTSPRWVLDTCARWTAEHGDAVRYVCRRARRGLLDGEGAATQSMTEGDGRGLLRSGTGRVRPPAHPAGG